MLYALQSDIYMVQARGPAPTPPPNGHGALPCGYIWYIVVVEIVLAIIIVLVPRSI